MITPSLALATGSSPTAPDVHVTTAEDTGVTGNLLTDATDPEGDPLSIMSHGQFNAALGSVSITNATGAYTFTPALNASGSGWISFAVTDGTSTSFATMSVTVTAVNDAPACSTPVTSSGSEDGQQSGTLACTDVDSAGLTYALVGAASHGTAQVQSDGAWTYTPDANYNGADSFTFQASDGSLDSNTATMSVTVTAVNDAPACSTPVTSSGSEDGQQSGTLACTDVDSAGLTYALVGAASHGTAQVQSDGAWTYTPDANYNGADSFTFQASDGSLDSNTATMSVTVTAVNDAPACGAVSKTVNEDSQADGTFACTDVEGSPLTYDEVAGPSHGIAQVQSNGAWSYTPSANYHGSDSFTYKANDGSADSAPATVAITVATVNDPPVVQNGTVTVTEDTPTNVTSHLLALATDADNDPLHVASVANATGGTASLSAGVVTFTAAANACGTGEGGFDFTIADTHGGSDTGHATVNVTCVNDAPVAPAQAGTAGENVAAKAFDVLAMASDADHDDTISIVTAAVAPSAGAVSFSPEMVWYTPAHDFVGRAAITYTITDGHVQASGTLTVTVSADTTGPVVATPTAAFGSGRVNESAPMLIRWSASDVSGVASYQVQVSVAGGAFASVYSGRATSITKFYALNKSLVWRVRAQDGVGNWSAWTSSATRKIVAYQAPGTSLIRYGGTWTTVISSGSSGVGYRYTRVYGKDAHLSFSGLGVLYVAPKLWTGGYVKVYVDNVLVGKYSTYKATTALGQIIARKSWSASGSHLIKIVNAQSGRRIGLDAFLVLR